MNILFVTHHSLSGNGGGTFATRAYINAFAENVDEMTVVYYNRHGKGVSPEINSKIHFISVDDNVSKWKRGLHILCGKSHRFDQIVPQVLSREAFDIVVFDNSKTSFGLIDIAHQHGCKVIVINHNYEYEYERDNSMFLLRPWLLYTIKKVEKESAQKADLNLTLTLQDSKLICDAFRNGNQDNFKFLGAFEYVRQPIKEFEDQSCRRSRFVITGNLGAMQTERSIIPWLKDFYPILKEEFPASTLTIAGKSPSSKIRSLCKDRDVNLIASPESMDSIMKEADYYICPTALGGGIKLRVMDGLKWGLPVISHSVSARGYEKFIQSGCMYPYNTIDDFREALQKLKKQSFQKQQVYNTYRGIFSFEAGIERVKEIIENL